MLDTLWAVFLGSLLILAISFVWVVILAIVLVPVNRSRKGSAATPTKITVKNVGDGTVELLEVRNVTTGKEQRIQFVLEPGYSKTIDVNV